MKITWTNNWPLVEGMPLETGEYKEIIDNRKATTHVMDCNLAWMSSQITWTNPETLEIEAPKCCNIPGEYLFTSSRGIPYFKCNNCSRFFSIAEGV